MEGKERNKLAFEHTMGRWARGGTHDQEPAATIWPGLFGLQSLRWNVAFAVFNVEIVHFCIGL